MHCNEDPAQPKKTSKRQSGPFEDWEGLHETLVRNKGKLRSAIAPKGRLTPPRQGQERDPWAGGGIGGGGEGSSHSFHQPGEVGGAERDWPITSNCSTFEPLVQPKLFPHLSVDCCYSKCGPNWKYQHYPGAQQKSWLSGFSPDLLN